MLVKDIMEEAVRMLLGNPFYSARISITLFYYTKFHLICDKITFLILDLSMILFMLSCLFFVNQSQKLFQ